ncbi:MAG: hypothetical protein PWQ82_535 [Thermosediminibacterales bacterium]|nr:hypothetical protein [Thermosediminibacterales bacterium]
MGGRIFITMKSVDNLSIELNTILNSTHNGIVAVDKDGYITILNPAAERVIGKKAVDAIGKHISCVIPNTLLIDVLQTGESNFSQKLLIGNRTVITNRTPILKNGEVVGAVAVFQDISELETISKELNSVKELNAELNAIIESSYDGIYVTDGNGTTLRVNSAYERITGVMGEEVIGRHMRDLEKAGFYSQSVTLLVLEKKKPMTIMQTIKGKKDVIVTGNPIFDENGKITRVVTNVRDITELNRLKDELEKTKKLTKKYYDQLSELRLQQIEMEDIITKSNSMRQIIILALRVSRVDSNVLITGESGVGKELIAKLIHKESDRCKGPFIKINCGAIPENLLESELFGYEGGAFSGAKKEGKPGLFEVAEGGTLLLDEIADLSFKLQVKLLRAIQEREIIRVGGIKERKIDVRILASTNKDLKQLVEQGKFREDLFYRLNAVPICVPPLRERKEDIVPLIYHFLKKFSKKYGLKKTISSEVINQLIDYDWPGNVRELENIIERLVVVAEDDYINIEHLPNYLKDNFKNKRTDVFIKDIIPLDDAISKLEKQLIEKAIKKYKSLKKVAEALGVHRTTVIRKKRKYNI